MPILQWELFKSILTYIGNKHILSISKGSAALIKTRVCFLIKADAQSEF